MKRRELLRYAAALTAASAAPSLTRAEESMRWQLGFQGVTEDLMQQPMRLQGSIPASCRGTFYRNGPARYQRGDQRYRHWFDPDGMIQAFTLDADSVTHRGRFVRTRKFKQEEAAGRFLFDGAGTRFADSIPARNNQDFNVANINVQSFDGELLALWEAGSAHPIDADTLKTGEPVQWSAALKGVPFSAHPHFDQRGDMWNIGAASFASKPSLLLYHIAKSGAGGARRLRKVHVQPLDFMGYMHDFVLTPRYLVVLNSSSLMGHGDGFVDSMTWSPSRPSQLLFFDRDDFSLVKTIEVPPTFVFHFGNAWEDSDRLFFTASEYADDRIATQGMYRLVQGEPGPYYTDPRLVRYSVDFNAGRAEKVDLGSDMEFPVLDKRRPFAAQRLLGIAGGRARNAGMSSALVRIDPTNGAVDQYDYGEDVIVEEPQLIPAVEGPYVIHSFLNVRQKRSGIALLRTDELSKGPIAIAHMDRVLPLGFHGCFVSR